MQAFIAIERYDDGTGLTFEICFWNGDDMVYQTLFDRVEEWQYDWMAKYGIFEIVYEDMLATTVEKDVDPEKEDAAESVYPPFTPYPVFPYTHPPYMIGDPPYNPTEYPPYRQDYTGDPLPPQPNTWNQVSPSEIKAAHEAFQWMENGDDGFFVKHLCYSADTCLGNHLGAKHG